MIRQAILSSGALLATHGTESSLSPARSFSSRKQTKEAKSSGPSTAEEWVASLRNNQKAIHSAITEITELRYNQSSRANGEMSKVSVTAPIDKLRLHAPASVIDLLKATQYYAPSSDALVIGSDEYLTQGANHYDCFKKLSDVYLKAGEDAVKRERFKGPPQALAKKPPKKFPASEGEARRRFVDKKRMALKEKFAERGESKMAQEVLVKEKGRASASQGK